jgi:hypothetical protein
MEAHTPKRSAIEKYLQKETQHSAGWNVRAIEQQQEPLILLEATRQGDQRRTLEVHSRQVTLKGEELDPSTEKMILRWLESLNAKSSHV